MENNSGKVANAEANKIAIYYAIIAGFALLVVVSACIMCAVLYRRKPKSRSGAAGGNVYIPSDVDSTVMSSTVMG